MALNFTTDFVKRLETDLVRGGFKDSTEFARAITKYYMQTVVKGAPLGIPATLPSPVSSGAPAPVGPPVKIPYQKREKIFYNTVRSYLYAKDLANGQGYVQFLTRDLQYLVDQANSTRAEITRLVQEAKDVDNKIQELREQIQSIGPNVQKFIDSKKEAYKGLKEEIQKTVEALRQVNLAQTFIQAGGNFAETSFSRELALIDTLTAFKFDIKQLGTSIKSITSILDEASKISKKYQNDFSTTANIRNYVWKKLRAFVNEVFELLTAFINPGLYKSYFRELLYVPYAQKLARIMLSIINKNEFLKKKKKQLILRIQYHKRVLKKILEDKLVNVRDAIEDKAAKLIGKLQNTGLVQGLQQTIKLCNDQLQTAKQWTNDTTKTVRYYLGLILDSIKIVRKVVLLGESLQKYYDLVFKGEIIRATRNKVDSLIAKYSTLSLDAENLTIKDVQKAFRTAQTVTQAMIQAIQTTFQVSLVDTAKFLKSESTKLDAIFVAAQDILGKDIPNLLRKIQNPPNKQQQKPAPDQEQASAPTIVLQEIEGELQITINGDKPPKRKKIRPADILTLMESALVRLAEASLKIRQKIDKKVEKLIKESQKLQQTISDYLNEITNFDATAKKINQKKGEVDEKRIETEEKRKKVILIAKSTILFGKMTVTGMRILDRVTPPANIEPRIPNLSISQNEADIVSLYNLYGQWQILTNKRSRSEVQTNATRLKSKLKDLKVYEKLFELGKDLFIEISESENFKTYIKQAIQEQTERQADRITNQWKSSAAIFENLISNPPKTLNDYVNVPLALTEFLNINTSLMKGESLYLKKFKTKIANIQDEIPETTQDPILKFFRDKILKRAGSVVQLFIDLFARGVRFLRRFLKRTIVDPILKTVKQWVDQFKEKQEQRAQENLERRLDKEARRKLDAKLMSSTFGLAARLFWTGFSWKNPVGTTFTVLNIGPFRDIIAEELGSAQGFSEQVGYGFVNQLGSNVRGLAIPNPSTGIPPFTWTGYL